MSSQLEASNARSMGNYGLWETARREPGAETCDDEDFDTVPASVSRWAGWRGSAIRWSLAAGVFLAYVNHWPGGH